MLFGQKRERFEAPGQTALPFETGPKRILESFTGYLQTDGYQVYEDIGVRPEVVHLDCWAHARRAAMIYSLLGTCKMHGVNPHQWLSHVLQNILSTKYNEIRSLYPQNFKSNT